MATYRFAAQLISRAKGRSATAAAAYRSGERIRDARTGEVFDYRRRRDVLDRTILAPAEVEGLFADRADLWNAAEAAENRRDAQVAREIQVSLPYELALDANRAMLHEFARGQFVEAGMIADVAIHGAHLGGDERNVHGHILLTTRTVSPTGFGPKARDWNDRALLERWREEWAATVNRALERASIAQHVSHLSYAARGIDLEPEPKQGPRATQMERRGRESFAGRDRRAARARNAERKQLRALAARLSVDIAKEARAELTAPRIRPHWQTSREEQLSQLYSTDLAGSDLARFWRIRSDGGSIIYENARGRFVDDGESVTARDGNDLEIRGMLLAAKAHGWKTVEISGKADFKMRAMRTALDHGFDVRATGRDAAILDELRNTQRTQTKRDQTNDRRTEWNNEYR